MSRFLKTVRLQKPSNNFVCSSGVVVEVEVVASVRVEVGLELGILPDGASRLLEDTLAFSITDDVVGFARDSLSCVSIARKRKSWRAYQSCAGEAAGVKVAVGDCQKLSDAECLLVLFAVGCCRQIVVGILEVPICCQGMHMGQRNTVLTC